MTGEQWEEMKEMLGVKNQQEDKIGRRNNHIKWLWACIIFIFTTGGGWIITGTLWYAKMEHVARAVDQIYLKLYGTPMP